MIYPSKAAVSCVRSPGRELLPSNPASLNLPVLARNCARNWLEIRYQKFLAFENVKNDANACIGLAG